MAKNKATNKKKFDKDEQNLGLFKEVMSVMFGIQDKQLDRIMDIINNSEDKLNIKTYIVRDKSGPRAVKYLRTAVEYARHEGSAKHETGDDDFEMINRKDQDIETSARGERPQDFEQQDEIIDMEKPIKECTFRDYLMELQVSDDPAQAMLDVKTATRNPDRYRKQQAADAVTKERDVKRATEDPNQREKLMLIQKQKLADQAAKQLATKEARTAQDMGAARPMTGMSS